MAVMIASARSLTVSANSPDGSCDRRNRVFEAGSRRAIGRTAGTEGQERRTAGGRVGSKSPTRPRGAGPRPGIEPMTYALRGARSRAAHTLAAPIPRIIALMALAGLGLSKDPFHARGLGYAVLFAVH